MLCSAIPRLMATRTILLVDDDPAILRLAESILSAGGFQVLSATGARNAIKLFEESSDRIQLLLTDVVMPDLSGPVLAMKLRAQRPDLNVLFMSGFHDTSMVQRYVTMNGFALLPKPFSRDGLLRAVQASIH